MKSKIPRTNYSRAYKIPRRIPSKFLTPIVARACSCKLLTLDETIKSAVSATGQWILLLVLAMRRLAEQLARAPDGYYDEKEAALYIYRQPFQITAATAKCTLFAN